MYARVFVCLAALSAFLSTSHAGIIEENLPNVRLQLSPDSRLEVEHASAELVGLTWWACEPPEQSLEISEAREIDLVEGVFIDLMEGVLIDVPSGGEWCDVDVHFADVVDIALVDPTAEGSEVLVELVDPDTNRPVMSGTVEPEYADLLMEEVLE